MQHRILTACLLNLALCACTRVIVSKHPGYNFPPTPSDSILVYDQIAPDYPFVIIGRISLDTTWTVKPKRDQKKIERMAAQAGADAIIIAGLDIKIDAFNQYVSTHGYSTVAGRDLSDFAADIYPQTEFLHQTLTYGYLIKRTENANGP